MPLLIKLWKEKKIWFPDKIRYLTMTDASKVWMPDTFFRWFSIVFDISSHFEKGQNHFKENSMAISNWPGTRKREDSTKYSLRTFTSVFSRMEMSYIGIFQDFSFKSIALPSIFPFSCSIRVSLVVACSMHLHLFPLDQQTCHLNVASCNPPNFYQKLQELQMLSSVTLNCLVTKIVMNSGSQLSEL